MTDRDTFAAAALTGLLDKSDAANPENIAAWWPEVACAAAYRWADAMLAARKPPAKPSGVAESYATAQQISDAQDFVRYREEFEAWKKEFEAWKKASSDAESAKTATTEPRSGALGEPVAWANLYPDEEFVHFDRAYVEQCSDEGEVVPLYRSPTLTDEEREAVKLAADFLEDEFYGCSDKCAAEHNAVATLRKLLERLE